MTEGLIEYFAAAHPAWVDIAQLLTAVLAVLIAAGSLLFTILESRRNQKHTEFSLSPALVAHQQAYEHDGVLGHKIKNLGNGPAIIDEIYFVYDGVPINATNDAHWHQGIVPTLAKYKRADLIKKYQGIQFAPGGAKSGSVFGSGFELWVVMIHCENFEKNILEKHQDFILNSGLVVFFRSFYGKRFNSIDEYRPTGNMVEGLTPAEWMAEKFPEPPKQ